MAKTFWTDKEIYDLPPQAGGADDHVVWHPKRSGFGVRFFSGKPVSYVIMYRIGGRLRKRTVGKVARISLTKALDEAAKDFGTLAGEKPVDPIIERKYARDLHNDRLIDFVEPFLTSQRANGLAQSYLDAQTSHLKGLTHKRTGATLPAYFADLHELPVKLIDRGVVATALDKITAERGQIAMSRARATLSKFFTWMIERIIAETNPVDGTKKFNSVPIDRTPSLDELKIIWNAADPTWQFGRIVRLLILTGARRDQIGGLKKSELDLEGKHNRLGVPMITLTRKAGLQERKRAAANGGVIMRRRGGSKNGETFHIPLSPQAVALFKLEAMTKDEYVFGDADAKGGFSGWSKCMPKLYEAIGDKITEHWTLHDVRRSFSTICVEDKEDGGLEQDATAVDACINHKPADLKKGVQGVYQYAKLLRKRTAVMNVWGAFVDEVTKPPKPDLKVVSG